METDILHANQGSAVWITGYCIFGDGEQRTMYCGEPRHTEEQHSEIVAREIAELVTKCHEMRRVGDRS
jgi:hypothetical protein